MAVFDSLAKSAATYLAKGWGKRQVAEKLLTLKKFSDNPQSVFKFRKDTGQYKYSTLFDRVWKSIGGEKVPKGQATETARKGRHLLKTAEEKADINKKIRATVKEKIKKEDWNLEDLAKWNLRGITLGRDPTLKGGYEGLIKAGVAGEKSSLGTALSSDVASIKGILSMLRAAVLHNPAQEANLLKSANLMKYNRQIQPYLKELDDVERQIRYWRGVGERSEGTPAFFQSRERDVQRLNELMEKYIATQYKLRKAIDPSVTLEGLQKSWVPKKVTWSHPAGLGANVEHAIAKGPGYKFSEYLTKDPKALTRYDPDLGPLNVGKDFIDYATLRAIRNPDMSVTRSGLDELSKLYKQAGVRSIMPSHLGKKMTLGEYDIGRQMDFLNRAVSQDKMPFHGLDTKKIMEILMRRNKLKDFGYKGGGVVDHFQAGGLASLLGKKLLKKIAGKISEKELKMLMGSLWKGVDPRRSPRYRVWDKNRWGPGYKWPWQKSKIKGPEMKKSHFASLTPGERVELQSKNADELWEYQMKKKLNKPMNEALEYPFLNPDKNSFIVTGPRTGLGRYQLQHYVDPEDVKPVQKYKVYDWWDDVLNKMHKKPKFKYVKDDKGKIILKEVK